MNHNRLSKRKMGKTQFTIKRNESIIGMFETVEQLSIQFTQKVKANPNSKDFGKYHSSIILHSLCLELSLKYLLDNSGIEYPRTHSLRKLFDALESELQESIKAEYDEKQTHKSNWLNFNELLIEIDHLFVEWRYATFDGNHLNIQIDSWFYFGNLLKIRIV